MSNPLCLWFLSACLSGFVPPPQPPPFSLVGWYDVPIIVGPPPPILIPIAGTTQITPATTATTTTTATPVTPAPTTPTTTAPTTVTTTTAAPATTASTATPAPTTTASTTTATTVTTASTTTPTTTASTTISTTTATTPAPSIDPRNNIRYQQEETPVRFGGIDYEDVVIEIDYSKDPILFPGTEEPISNEIVHFRNRRQATNCGCFAANLCPPNTTNTDGTGVIDFRIVNGGTNVPQCLAGLRYCCISLPTIPTALPTLPPLTTPSTPPATTPTPVPQQSCGSRIATGVIYPTQSGQARYGDYPWMVVILTTDNFYIAGGVLIDTQHVLTVSHRISSFPNGVGLKIRLGEWDAAGNYEQYPYRDFDISRVWTHESFNPNNLQNDVSLIRILGGVPTGSLGIIPVCLPSATQNFDGQRCWVSGWGKNAFGITGLYQTVLKTVDVPMVAQAACETQLRATRLGPSFVLDRPSFICAGGELNKDACTGDGGSGLVCETTPGRWTLAGLVAWGIGCATQGVPAAYVNIPNYIPWIISRQAQAG